MPGLTRQTSFESFEGAGFTKPSLLLDAVEQLASCGTASARGAIFTRVEVVDFILDLVGYTDDKLLNHQRVLEPSFGCGDFLLPLIGRLISAWRRNAGKESNAVDELKDAIRAVELHRDTFLSTRAVVIEHLKGYGISIASATTLADCWLLQGDFLLESFEEPFDFVVGNPPYVRQELIPAPLLDEYRNRYKTMYDRVDLYIPFIERALLLLAKGGTLGYICADRWMKNRYGGPLRKLITEEFNLKMYVDMVDTPAFHSEVSAYPAITIIGRGRPGTTRLAYRPQIDRATLSALAEKLCRKTLKKDDETVSESALVMKGTEPWLLESDSRMALVRRIEGRFPSLEQVGCKVGIGVATGADRAFIGDLEALDVELDRKLPLVTTRDIQSGEINWQGRGVVNPFHDNGDLVDLAEYPRLSGYLEARRELIAGRHCARKSPAKWYRTIDRISPELVKKPKLLIPDIKSQAHIVFEPGGFTHTTISTMSYLRPGICVRCRRFFFRASHGFLS